MHSTFHAAARARRTVLMLAATSGVAMVSATPALAQSGGQPGPYGVARAGVQLDTDLRLGGPIRPRTTTPVRPGTPRPTPTPTTSPLPNSIDADAGFVGELGAGYDFSGLRLEATVGYGSAGINDSRLSDRTNIGDGRLKSLDLGVAGYVDFNKEGIVRPFIGGGIGASRVSAEVSRLARPTATTPPRPGNPTTPAAPRTGTRIDQNDWGFRWHLDAGVGYEVSPGTTLELAGRYARITSLDLQSSTVAVSGTTTTTTVGRFEPRMSSTSLMLGLRQKF